MKQYFLILALFLMGAISFGQCVEGDCQNGYGKEFTNDYTYTGFYKEGKYDGFALVEYGNGDVFKGAFLEGKPHGAGILTTGNGSRTMYAEYEEGGLNGVGFVLEGGNVIEANKYKNGKVVKVMELEYTSNVVNGNCQGNCMGGFGLEAYGENDYYYGFFASAAFEGVGIRIFNDGSLYKGGFSKSKRNGFGEYNWANGDVYMGMWKGGKRNGPGVFIHADGKEDIGFFKNDKYIGKEE